MKLAIRPLIALAGAACLSLAACADPGSGGTSETGNDPNKSYGLEINEDARNLLPQEILDRGYVTVAADIPYPPFGFLDEDGKTIIGADPDLGAALGEVLGIDFRFVATSQANIIPGLESGKYDLAMSGMADRYERQESVTFVDYMQNAGTFVVRPDAEVKPATMEEACGLTVAVQSATTMADTLHEESDKCASAGKEPIAINEFQGQDQALLALSSKRVEVAVVPAGSAAYMQHVSPEEFEVVTNYNEPGKLGIALPNGQDELVAAIEAALKVLFENGTYEKILNEWGLYEHNSIDEVTINDAKDKPKE